MVLESFVINKGMATIDNYKKLNSKIKSVPTSTKNKANANSAQSNSAVAKTGVVPIYDTSKDDSNIKAINDELKNIEWSGNVLRKYTSPTYVMSMYMLPYDVEQELDRKYSQASNFTDSIENTVMKISDNKKFYIFYEGISGDFSVENFTVKSFFGPNQQTRNSQYYEMKLTLKEINNCAFAEKIRQMALALGYDNYFDLPFYIDIKFLGYAGKYLKGHNVKEDLPAEVWTNELPNEKSRVAKFTYKVAITKAKPNVDDWGTTWTLDLVPHSGSGKDANVMLVGDANHVAFTSKFGDFLNKFEDVLNKRQKEQYKDLYKGSLDEKLVEIIPSNDLKDLVISEKIKAKESKDTDKTDVTFDPKSSIPMCIEDIFKNIETDKSEKYIPRVVTTKILIGKLTDGTMLYKWIHRVYALRTSYVSAEEIKETSSDKNQKALEYLKEIKKTGTFVKKYQYYNTGIETEVIKFSPLFDNMYYVPVVNSIISSKSKNALGNTSINKEIEEKANNDTEKQKYSQMTDINDIAGVASKKYDKFRSQSGLFLLNNFYRNIQKNGYRKPPVKPVTLVDINQDSTNPDNNKTYEKELMYSDIFSAGNAIKLNLTIHGDPYWLGNPVTGAATYPSYRDVNYHKIAFKYAGPHDVNETCYFGFNGIYTVISVKSVFAEGKFTQDIEAVADEKFYHRTDWEF